MSIYTWHDILKRLDPTDFAGTTDRLLAAALLAVEARDWFIASGLSNLGYCMARSDDWHSRAVFLIVRGVAQFHQRKLLAAIGSLERAISVLHRLPNRSAQMNEAIASISLSIVLAKKPNPRPKTAAIALAQNAQELVQIASTCYAAKRDLNRWQGAKELADWVGERLDGAVPTKYIVQT